MNDSLIRTPRARRWGARVSAVTGIAVVGVVATSGIAFACHAIPNPDISKTSYSCTGDVHYQVDSWSQDATNANATNPKVRVEVSVNGGAYTTVAEAKVGPGAPITGVWNSPVTVASAIVRATPEVPWSGGDKTEEARSEPVSLVNGPCVALPAAAISPASCTTGSSSVTLSNTGTRPAALTVTGTAPAFTTTATVPAAGTAVVAVPVTEGAASTIAAAFGSTVLATQQVARSCQVIAPTSVITADCTGMSALLDNSASNVPVTFTVAGPTGSTDYVVAAGKTLTTPAEAVTDGQTAIMTVTANGKTIASEHYTAACTPVAPVTPAVPVVPVVPTTPVAPAAPVVTVAPVVPTTPVAPAAPVVTVAPVVPAAPVATVAPVTPVTPVTDKVASTTAENTAQETAASVPASTFVGPVMPVQTVKPVVKAVTLSRAPRTVVPASVGLIHSVGTSVRAASFTRTNEVVQPTGQLAFTGANHLGLLALSGLGLIAAGGCAIIFGRRTA